MSHRNARLTEYGRRLLVERVAGRPVAHVAVKMGESRATGHKWWRRFRKEGQSELADRPSRPRTSPTRTSAEVEHKVLQVRQDRRLGPARIAGLLDVPASTVNRILARHRMPKLAWLDRPTGEQIRRPPRTPSGV